jgi:diguanylate cyclase (GGDEF)-like protein
MTSAATRAARPSSRIARVVAAVFLGWAALYLWPLVDGSSESSFDAVDVSLRLAATLAASGGALLAALRSAGAQRWAFGSLAVGANVWATVQAVRWGYIGPPGSAAGWLAVAGSAAFGVAAVAAVMQLLLAGGPSGRRRGPLDVALIAGPVVLAAWSAGFGEIVALTEGVAPATSPAARLLLDGVLVTLTCVLLARRPLVRGLPVLGAGLLAIAFADGVAVAFAVRFQQAPERLVGLLTCAGLTLVVLAVLTATSGDDDEPTVAPLRPSVLPTVLPALAGLAVLLTVLRGEPLDAVEAALLLVLGGLALVRQHVAVREANDRLVQLAGQEAEMRHLAFHDELTGLANRALFLDRLEHALELHRRYRRPLAVLFCDLDDFKAVNDTHGHLAGDEVLRVVAARLSTTLRPADTFARLGGDEFAVLLEQDADPAAVARRMRAALETPFRLGAHSVDVGLTIGLAKVDALEATPTAATLLERADAEMYAAKRAGEGRRLIPVQDVPVGAGDSGAERGELSWTEAVLHAFARDVRAGLVEVVYQPVVDPASGAVPGLEALARWSYGGKPVLPGTFIALAERAGLIAALTDVVLDRACAQLRAWSVALGHERLTVSVNVAAEQMLDRDFPRRVTGVLERHGIARDQLVLELTADALTQDPTTAYAVSNLLREAGVLLSLGEFTHDPVALGHLHRLPLASIKVDGEEQGALVEVAGQERVMRACHSLARELDLRVVVEGVERAEQLTVVRRIGGLLAQGFLLARPAPAAQLDDMVLHGLRLPD